MQDNIKHKIEAILFTVGRSLTIQQIADLIHFNKIDLIESTLQELKKEYKEKSSSLEIIQDNNLFRMNIKSDFFPLVKDLMPNTELERPVISTLATIAWKSPVLQSEIVKIRGNTAYEHIKILSELNFIVAEKHKLTKIIKLSPKFYEYFDTNKDKFQNTIKNIEEKKQPIKDGKIITPDLLKDV